MIHAFMLILLFNSYKLVSSAPILCAYIGLILAFYWPRLPKFIPLLGLAFICIFNQRVHYDLGMTKHSQVLFIQMTLFLAVAFIFKLSVLKASHVAIASYYLTAGVTKLKNSLHYWVVDAKNIAFSMIRASDENFYTDRTVTSLGNMDKVALWIYEHELLVQLAFFGVLLLELSSILILCHQKFRKVWGLMIVGLHAMMVPLLDIKFLNNIYIVLIFCVFSTELEWLFLRLRGFTKSTLILPLLFFLGGCSSAHHRDYRKLHYKSTRSRPLEDLEKRMVPYSLVQEISSALKRKENRPLRILEIGQGNGRVLLTLMKLFRGEDIEYFGINQKVSETFSKQADYRMTALKFGIFDKETVREMKLPEALFVDVDNSNALPFPDDYFDIIFSQSTMQHIERKFELLEENVRALKENGVALHTSFRNVFLYRKGNRVPMVDFFNEVSKEGNIQLIRANKEDSIFLRKLHTAPLKGHFNLKLCQDVEGNPVLKDNVIEYHEKKSCYSI